MKIFILSFAIVAMALITNAADMPSYPFIYVEGYATKEVAPDTAEIYFTLEVRNAISAKAMEEIDKQSKNLLKYFSKQKISSDDIWANRIEKESLNNGERGSERKIIGYQASRHFSVTVRDLSSYIDIAQMIYTSTNIVGAATDFQSSKKEEIQNDLLIQACQNAKDKATQLANGFGRKIGSVQAITQENFYGISRVFGMGYGDSGRILQDDPSSMLEGFHREDLKLYVPATITFNNSVMAIFRIEPDK